MFSAEVGGLRILALREGRFLFDFSAWPGYMESEDENDFDAQSAVAVRRAEVLNSHVLCLHVALTKEQRIVLRKPVVSPLEFISYDDLAASASHGWVDQRLTPLLTASSIASYNQLSPNVFDWRLGTRFVVSAETLAESTRLLESVLEATELPLRAIADLYLRSTAYFESHDYNLALVGSWAIVETALQVLWQRYIDDNRTREVDGEEVAFINSERRNRLISGRDYTASVVSETLSLLDVLSHATYVELDKVRKDRNAFLHDLTAVSRNAADRALSVAEEMLNLIGDFQVAVPRLSLLGG